MTHLPTADSRTRAGAPCALFLVFAGAVGSSASAQPVAEPQDFPVEQFRLSTDREGILDVEWAGVLGHGQWQLALWTSYSDDPLAAFAEEDGGGRSFALVDQRLAAGFVASVGLFDNLQLGLELPLTLYQSRNENAPGLAGTLSELDAGGFGDLRIVPKVLVLNQPDHGIDASLVVGFRIPLGAADAYLREQNVAFEPTLLVGRRFGRFRTALNVGYRARRASQLLDLEVDDEVFFHLGAAYQPHPLVEVDLSAYLAFDANDAFASSNTTPMEVRVGATFDVSEHLAPFVGIGAGIVGGYGTPDYRIFAGVRAGRLVEDLGICPGEEEDLDGFEDDDGCPDPDNDRDGVLDAADACPMDPEDRDGFGDEDGCPDPDDDGDGVPDESDLCPEDMETANGFEDDDGCPDEIPDTDGDGLADNVDACPGQAEDADGFEDADGCPDPDNDQDGVPDSADPCRDAAGPAENFGCPEIDADGDGVVDRIDACPAEAGSTDASGCAQAPDARIEGDFVVPKTPLRFAGSTLRLASRSAAPIAALLRAHAEIRELRVEVVASDAQTAAARAESVRVALVAAGLDEGRVRASGSAGEEALVRLRITERGPRTGAPTQPVSEAPVADASAGEADPDENAPEQVDATDEDASEEVDAIEEDGSVEGDASEEGAAEAVEKR